jgi:hypothetical protein
MDYTVTAADNQSGGEFWSVHSVGGGGGGQMRRISTASAKQAANAAA